MRPKKLNSLLACMTLSCLPSTKGMKRFSVSKIHEERLDVSAISKHRSGDIINDGIDTNDVQELYVEQRLDHFRSQPSTDSGDKSNVPFSFSQRYFYSARYIDNDIEAEVDAEANSKYTNNNLRHKKHINTNFPDISESDEVPSTFVFICVGGEGPSLDKTVLTNSEHCSGDMLALASILYTERKANVHVFALEHRYYGASYPEFTDGSSPVTNENLVYLSSRQALADLAHFIKYAKEEYDIVGDAPVVTFGGSYPGMLAAWGHLKYPHLIHAAVSNSAPLQVILNFSEYLNVYARSLSNPMVGGSEKCFDIIHQGHEEIAKMLSLGGDENKEYIASLFNLCDGADALEDEKNVKSFVGDGVVFLGKHK